MPTADPAAATRAAVARAVMPTATTRLVTLDAADLVATDAVAAHLAFATPSQPAPLGTARVDPLRLPLIEAVADAIIAREALGADVPARLREFWRVLAPAGVLVLVVALPSTWSLRSMIVRRHHRGNVARVLAAAMFDLDTQAVVPGALVARAIKSDGLAPQQRRTATVIRRATA